MFGFLRKHDSSLRLQRLQTVPLFASLTPREQGIVNGLLHERSYLADEVIFDQGEEGQALYIVLAGRVSIRRANAGHTSVIGEERAGDFFGDLALLDDSPRFAQARAVENCELAVFFRADFFSLLDTHALIASKISLQLARSMAQRLRHAVTRAGLEAGS